MSDQPKHNYILMGLVIAFSYWFLDSAIHYWGYGEFEFEVIPSDFNELWMRIAIFVLVITFAVYCHFATRRETKLLEEKLRLEQALQQSLQNELAAERRANSSLRDLSTEVNQQFYSFLNQLHRLREEFSQCGELDKSKLQQLDQLVRDTSSRFRNTTTRKEPGSY